MEQELSAEQSLIDRQPLLRERFEVLSILGEGASGTVYKVRDRERGGAVVALKILQNTEAFDENTRRRFRKEINVARSFRHPNFVQAFELLEGDHGLAYTMEFVEGADLGRLFEGEELSPAQIDGIFSQLLDCLGELHTQGYVHRDIKLENILVRPDGFVKLSDLGLMKDLNNTKITRTGVLLGTAQYMPPEYVRRGVYDARGDIYAAGVLLYEILSRKRRLADYPGMRAIEHLVQTKFELPKLPLQGAPRKYVRIIEKASALKPADRYQSAAEMKADFVEEPEGEEVEGSYRSTTLIGVKARNAGAPLRGRARLHPAVFAFAAFFSCATVLISGLAMRSTGDRPAVVEKPERHDAGLYQSLPEHYVGGIDLSASAGGRPNLMAQRLGAAINFSSDSESCVEGTIDLVSGRGSCRPAGWILKIGKISDGIYGDVVIQGRKAGSFVLGVRSKLGSP